VKSIAFYLPQFYPIPENDEWWGPGYTEWTSVAKARPMFRGHYQPHIPADLGFYDLRLRETRIAQADLARRYGIGGFCYYHYWFNGKLLLERPFEAVLADQEPEFPFCLCWANQSWNRVWDGLEHQVLIEQNLAGYDPDAHFEYLGKAFFDPRYIRIDGKPVFLLYRIDQFPQLRSTIERWRAKAQSMGLPGIYLCAVRSYYTDTRVDAETIALGFDAIVGFEPHSRTLRPQRVPTYLRYLFHLLARRKSIGIWNYSALVRAAMDRQETVERAFPCVMPSWDNSARRSSGAQIVQNDDAELFEAWLRDAARRVASYPEDEQIVFINAWNEWAEGCHLEPDLRNGHRFLEAVQKVFGTSGTPPREQAVIGDPKDNTYCSHSEN
jgi:lipopolysaccharide biosynthesis protein